MKNSLFTIIKVLTLYTFPFFLLTPSLYPETLQKAILRGDKLVIRVMEQEDLNGVYDVSSNGTIEFPLIPERITAEGLNHDELAQKIKEKLEEKYFYQATVSVAMFTGNETTAVTSVPPGGVVYVYGMVGSSGAVNIPESETLTVSKVIIRCGGFRDFANKKTVKLVRKSQATGKAQTTILNMVDIIDKGKIEKDVVVRDGDMIVVPEKFFNF